MREISARGYQCLHGLAELIDRLTSGAPAFIRHGFDPARPLKLDAALRQHPVINPFAAMLVAVNGFRIAILWTPPSPDGRNPSTFTVWIFDPGRTQARYITPAEIAPSSLRMT